MFTLYLALLRKERNKSAPAKTYLTAAQVSQAGPRARRAKETGYLNCLL